MIVYKDMAFCSKSFYQECLESCPRSISEEDRQKAEELELPFSVSDFSNEGYCTHGKATV